MEVRIGLQPRLYPLPGSHPQFVILLSFCNALVPRPLSLDVIRVNLTFFLFSPPHKKPQGPREVVTFSHLHGAPRLPLGLKSFFFVFTELTTPVDREFPSLSSVFCSLLAHFTFDFSLTFPSPAPSHPRRGRTIISGYAKTPFPALPPQFPPQILKSPQPGHWQKPFLFFSIGPYWFEVPV